MEYAVIVIMVALIQYEYFATITGTSRSKHGVHPPKTTGNETWERLFRIQQNTLEQLIVFVPGVVAFAWFVSPKWVIVPGVAFIAGRQLYSWSYLKDPKGRGPGFAMTFLSNAALVIGSLIGAVMSAVK